MQTACVAPTVPIQKSQSLPASYMRAHIHYVRDKSICAMKFVEC